MLRTGKHPCSALQADWAIDGFAFEVLECGNGPDVRAREQAHLEQYRAQGQVYNTNNASTLATTAITEDELFNTLYHLLPDPHDAWADAPVVALTQTSFLEAA